MSVVHDPARVEELLQASVAVVLKIIVADRVPPLL